MSVLYTSWQVHHCPTPSKRQVDKDTDTFYLLYFFYPFAGVLGCLTWVRLQQPQEQCYLFLTVRAVFSCLQTKVRLPMLEIFNVHTDVNACDSTWGLYGYCKRICAECWLREKIPCCTRELNSLSVACQSDALPTELHPHPCVARFQINTSWPKNTTDPSPANHNFSRQRCQCRVSCFWTDTRH